MPIIKTYYKVHRVFPDPDYFYMENTSGSTATFTVSKTGTPASTDLSYSLDKVTWTDIHNGGTITNIADGAQVYFRSSTGFNADYNRCFTFNSTNMFDVGGHVSNLLDYTQAETITSLPDYCFYNMFKGSTNLRHCNVDFSGIHSIGDASCCSMLKNCSNLITVPDLSGVYSIAFSGIANMCESCTSLMTPLDLTGVTSVGQFWGSSLYRSCGLLNDVIAPNISSWDVNNTTNWLSGTAATGVVRKPAGLTIPTDSSHGVPTGWTTENY